MFGPSHSIKVVARMTGLSPHVIRVWEKRYSAVTPDRTDSNRRLYSDAEVARLNLLRRAISLGHSIGTVARLESGSLASLVRETEHNVQANGNDTGSGGNHGEVKNGDSSPAERTVGGAPAVDIAAAFLRDAIDAVRRFQAARLEQTLLDANLALGIQGLLRRVVAPLNWAIGDLWHRGEITAAHEHFACGVIRVFLGGQIGSFMLATTAPVVVVTTPNGQLHEMGAVIAAAAAAANGWRVTYLGPSLPAVEIAGAAIQNRAQAVALSMVYPEDDPALPAELEKLRRYLPLDIKLIVGGRSAPAYRQALHNIGAIECADLDDLDRALLDIRQARTHAVPVAA